jgi:hypothetical protein
MPKDIPVRALTGDLLLSAWEAGLQARPEPRRPIALLSIALPGTDPGALAAMPVAERDLLLLRLRQLTFGPDLAVFATCPDCGEHLEFTLQADAMAAQLEQATAAMAAGPVEWSEGGYRYRLRPVTTDDLIDSLAAPGPDAAQELLLARCVQIAPEQTVASPPASSNPPSTERRFEQLHADAELRCAIDCPGCAGHHVLDMDIARFLWREVETAATRLLGDIHLLACAYGWREQDIVALSPHRRAAYLELVGA